MTDIVPLIIKLFKLLSFFKNIKNIFKNDKTGMGKHPRSIDDDIPEQDFKDRLKRVGESLADDLRSIDIQTNWSIKSFTSLDAEVEIINNRGEKRKEITDLLKAIRKSRDRLFLVLGDPGSGKSVSLRKLCQELVKEIDKTGKIPVYVNLKEWTTEYKWTIDNLPTVDDFSSFVKKNLRGRDIIISKFFDIYYDRLYESGRLFFVLDSFDEIPAVLDEKENSEIIRKLSNLLFKFLKGARSDSSQGILASRLFRKPTKEFQTNTILEIRPFSETKIVDALKKSGSYNSELIHKLFRTRQDLIPIARNPFSVALLSEYAHNNDGLLPKNQSDIYESFVNNTLISCQERMDNYNLKKIDVINGAIKIAVVMFRENLGFEASIIKLKHFVPDINIDLIIDILKFSKLGRVGAGDQNLFSFSHRRFCEYFVVQDLINKNENPDSSSIPNDSQWRDALVLYCEVAEEGRAIEIANFCWKKISELKSTSNLEVIHCLRFLSDAFKSRISCISHFRTELGNFIVSNINPESDMLGVKFAVEALGLLDEDQKNQAVMSALSINNHWINEIAFKSCRYFPNLHKELEKKLIVYIYSLPIKHFLFHKTNFLFSLNLSQGLKKVKRNVHVRYLDIIALTVSLTIFFSVYPLLALGNFTIVFFSTLIVSLLFYITENRIIKSNRYYDIALFNIRFTFLISLVILLTNLNFQLDFLKNTKQEFLFFNMTKNQIIFTITILFLFQIISLIKNIRIYIIYFDLDLTKVLYFIIALPIGLFISISIFKILKKYIDPVIFKYAFWGFFSVLLLYLFLHIIWTYFKFKKIYNEILFKKLNNREYIYSCFNDLKDNPYFLEKLISYIEINIHEASGLWPDNNFLQAKGDDYKVRLAKIDLRWKGFDS